jgi:hypothetical protein
MKSMCAFTGIETSLDECSIKCGEVYPLPPMKSTVDFVQTGSRTKIIHEAFESLEQREKKKAETSASIASSANEALATLGSQDKKNAGLEAVMKALRAAQSGEDEASKEAKAAEKDDSALAAASKVQESKFEATWKRVESHETGMSAVEAPASVFLEKSSFSQGCSLECMRRVGKCTCHKEEAPAFLQKSTFSQGCSLECLKKVGKCTCR